MTGTFLTAHWKHLVMLNFEVPAAVLAPYVPTGVELDDFEGLTLVSMVGFLFLDTRLKGVPIPFHRHFEEVNLRFYVRRVLADEVRRGVVFIKEIVPKKALALVARVCYNENYVALPMSHLLQPDNTAPLSVLYQWQLGPNSYSLGVRGAGTPTLPEPASEQTFITEHYWGYARQRDGGTVEYRVAHPQWTVSPVADSHLSGDMGQLYGSEWSEWLQKPARSAFLARGSEVSVYSGQRI